MMGNILYTRPSSSHLLFEYLMVTDIRPSIHTASRNNITNATDNRMTTLVSYTFDISNIELFSATL